MRRFTPIEVALGISLLGCVAAVAIPTFIREVHMSRFVEPTEGLTRLGASAIAHAAAQASLPDQAPLTPPSPPRGRKEVDPPGTWDHPTWQMLDFRAVPEDIPHAYSFVFEPAVGTFVARAHGDLDGDGIHSTFEIRGTQTPGEAWQLEPGMYVAAELE